jgi:hypothetical protein
MSRKIVFKSGCGSACALGPRADDPLAWVLMVWSEKIVGGAFARNGSGGVPPGAAQDAPSPEELDMAANAACMPGDREARSLAPMGGVSWMLAAAGALSPMIAGVVVFPGVTVVPMVPGGAGSVPAIGHNHGRSSDSCANEL